MISEYSGCQRKQRESVTKYVEQLLSTELELQEGNVINLKIQRAHRALAQKPPPTATPRSIVVNFLQFDTKEVILKKAWQKKISVGGKRIFFDHDYATAVVQKRKSYLGIKKVLKDKGIRFQTPLAKIRIYWEAGVKTYDDAIDAARDMRERGLEMEVPGRAAAPVEERRAQPVWQRVRGKEGRHDSARRAKMESLGLFCLNNFH
ncbi:LINE-1 retrotransposable element ORF1 protein [Dissostichus eleginoides]|uniref:LINE-1 retrotransposable element ORF1 protein n=1 Tax=Dissostichus eleginoides TaxID=100907 RepID=A0AAD9F6R5_DISEL|nr:LINE-1 retrotransposable element ORF1 protein [Dissostichus eleginoides]